MQLLTRNTAAIQKNALAEVLLILQLYFICHNQSKTKIKKNSQNKIVSNWHNKNSKLCFLKQQIFRCLLDPCAANNPRNVGEEHTHVTPLIASSTIVAIIIYLVFIEKWNHRCFVVFFNFSYKNKKRKKCTVFHFFFFLKTKYERKILKSRVNIHST